MSPDSVVLGFDGNSLTFGTGATAGNAYPDQTVAALSSSVAWHNFGTPSQSFAELMADAATTVDSRIDPYRTNVLVIWGGIKDINAGDSAETVLASMASYVSARYAAGWDKIVTVTVTPKAGDAFEAARLAYNDLLRADWADYVDALADPAAVVALQDPDDLTYYVDTLHMTDAGYALVAAEVVAALGTIGVD